MSERMSPADAAWLHLDHPTNLMHVAGIMTTDTPIDVARLQHEMAQRLLQFERFRQCAVQNALGQWQWENDPYFDLDNHLAHYALPAPGGRAELEAFASDWIAQPLDPARPLWHIALLDGFGTGSAVLLRIHHAIADGLALVYVLLNTLDDSPTAEETPEVNPPSADGRSRLAELGRTARDTTRVALGLTEAAVTRGFALFRHPDRALDLAAQSMRGATSLVKLVAHLPDSPSPFRGELSTTKRVAWTPRLPLRDIKALAHAHDATINDILLVLVTGAYRRYFQAHDLPVDGVRLRMLVPVALRPVEASADLGNRFGSVYLLLPVGEADPRARLADLKRQMDNIKRSPEALITFASMATTGLAPADLASRIIQLFQSRTTGTLVNVPGPRQPLYIAGARVRDMMFFAPLAGRLSIGVTMLSYAGGVTVGAFVDDALTPDPERLLEGFLAELIALKAAAVPS